MVFTLHNVVWSRALSVRCAREADHESAASAIRGVDGRRGANNVDCEVSLSCGVHDLHSAAVLEINQCQVY